MPLLEHTAGRYVGQTLPVVVPARGAQPCSLTTAAEFRRRSQVTRPPTCRSGGRWAERWVHSLGGRPAHRSPTRLCAVAPQPSHRRHLECRSRAPLRPPRTRERETHLAMRGATQAAPFRLRMGARHERPVGVRGRDCELAHVSVRGEGGTPAAARAMAVAPSPPAHPTVRGRRSTGGGGEGGGSVPQ